MAAMPFCPKMYDFEVEDDNASERRLTVKVGDFFVQLNLFDRHFFSSSRPEKI